MRILAIGNGFDIEHELRTKYSHFLIFVKWIFNGRQKKDDSICEDDKKTYRKLCRNNKEVITEFKGLINNNLWIDYFLLIHHKDNWVDFEKDISEVIKVFEKGRRDYIGKTNFYSDPLDLPVSLKGLSKRLNNAFENKLLITGNDFDDLRNQLLVDLKRITRALELYLSYWVDDSVVKIMNPNIASIHPNKVISFNYTHTFEKVYSKNDFGVEYCYIHGEAKKEDCTKNNMVLGIDDFEAEGSENGYFIGFKKYYQRLNNNNDTSYKKWIEDIEKNPKERNELYIFGHSLDVTDIEVFRPLLSSDKIKTTVYCYDEKSRSDLISNVIILIGKDLTISKMYSGDIRFVIQSKSKVIENSELEIRSDYHDLYRLDQLKLDEVDRLIKKIKNKINKEDIRYFNNLNSIISVVDALASNNLSGIVDFEKISIIADSLVKQNKYDLFFDAEEWVDFYANGQPYVEKDTERVVAIVNNHIANYLESADYNRSDFEKSINPNNYDSHKMNMNQFIEIFDNTLDYFSKKNMIDKDAIRYVTRLMDNSYEVGKALKKIRDDMMKESVNNTVIKRIVYSILYDELDKINYEEYLSSEAYTYHKESHE